MTTTREVFVVKVLAYALKRGVPKTQLGDVMTRCYPHRAPEWRADMLDMAAWTLGQAGE